jgi:hypothetical protein
MKPAVRRDETVSSIDILGWIASDKTFVKA